jgi:hypothetical protein
VQFELKEEHDHHHLDLGIVGRLVVDLPGGFVDHRVRRQLDHQREHEPRRLEPV